MTKEEMQFIRIKENRARQSLTELLFKEDKNIKDKINMITLYIELELLERYGVDRYDCREKDLSLPKAPRPQLPWW